MNLSDRVGQNFWKIFLPCALYCLSLSTFALSQTLPAPKALEVERDETFFYGRWNSVPGSSHYEVWVKSYGRWSFNEKEFETSPLTSSFQLPIRDERALFKVRAVSPTGGPGEFSGEVMARRKRSAESPDPSSTASDNSSAGNPQDFDPKAAPPEPPTSLFALWVDNTTIKLVWQESLGAKNYSVEEYREDNWVSIPLIDFPKPNTALLKNHPTPGPYRFRVRAVGKNGRASEPSRATTVER